MTPYADQLIAVGLAPDFLAQLDTAVTALDTAATTVRTHRAARVTATESLKQHEVNAAGVLKVLDRMVKSELGDNPPALAAWLSVKKILTSKTVTSTPAATTPVATTPVAPTAVAVTHEATVVPVVATTTPAAAEVTPAKEVTQPSSVAPASTIQRGTADRPRERPLSPRGGRSRVHSFNRTTS